MRGRDVDFNTVVMYSKSSGISMLIKSFLGCGGDVGFVRSSHGVESLHGYA